ncbi:NAD(P)H-dependent oxidoreductase subunit E [uncultured Brachyspira sp.]|uniref:NAD(P)H-dependent oxidoreductase subunit E n=1 Tax=uncultured Brachyspira sp. TaxID=221953 RepID=UPI0025D3529F|nr:NAD(P)H-dependent oxidoreductase subunit E [uncultured Brachyspira sp.]
MSYNVKTVIEVCVGLHCSIRGSYALLEAIRSHYDLQIGVPSYDGMLLKEMECMHNCRNAVPVLINGMECTKSSLKSIIKFIEAIHIRKR